MIAKNLKSVVQLSKKQYEKLVLQGYLDINGVRITYDPLSTIYATDYVNYVKVNEAQTLTTIEKTTARNNIDAASKDDINTVITDIDNINEQVIELKAAITGVSNLLGDTEDLEV